MTLADRLRALYDALPENGAVTLTRDDLAAWLTDATAPATTAADATADLTVGQVAELFGRGASTIRTWCGNGLLPGAYRMRGSREWRVPRDAIQAMQQAESERHRTPRQPARRTTAGPADLGAWRQHIRRSA